MKISLKDLKRIYRDFIIEKTPPSRKNCPPQENLLKFSRSKLSEKQKSKIIDHITQCSYCVQEFKFTLQILKDEKNFIEEIGKVLRAKGDPLIARRNKKIFFPILSWKYVSLFIGSIIIIFTVIIFTNLEKREYRGPNLRQIYLIEPVNKKYSRSPLIFKWGSVKRSEYYVLELFDQTLYPVWKSQRIFKNQVILPLEIATKLKENKTYFWMVTASLHQGGKIESRLEKFTITK